MVNCVGRMAIDECEPTILKTFLAEVMRRWHEDAASGNSSAKACLTCALNIWVKLLRPGQQDIWVKEISAMENRLLSEGNVSNLGQFAQALASNAPDMGLSPDEWDQMLSTLRQLYVRLLDGPLQVNTDAAENKAPADDSFKKENQNRDSIRMDLMVDHWAKLLAHGCSEQESNELFKRCPEKWKVKLAQNFHPGFETDRLLVESLSRRKGSREQAGSFPTRTSRWWLATSRWQESLRDHSWIDRQWNSDQFIQYIWSLCQLWM